MSFKAKEELKKGKNNKENKLDKRTTRQLAILKESWSNEEERELWCKCFLKSSDEAVSLYLLEV